MSVTVSAAGGEVLYDDDRSLAEFLQDSAARLARSLAVELICELDVLLANPAWGAVRPGLGSAAGPGGLRALVAEFGSLAAQAGWT